jgi:hypothetical protein
VNSPRIELVPSGFKSLRVVFNLSILTLSSNFILTYILNYKRSHVEVT